MAFRKSEFNGTSTRFSTLCVILRRINFEIDVPQLPNDFQLLENLPERPCAPAKFGNLCGSEN